MFEKVCYYCLESSWNQPGYATPRLPRRNVWFTRKNAVISTIVRNITNSYPTQEGMKYGENNSYLF